VRCCDACGETWVGDWICPQCGGDLPQRVSSCHRCDWSGVAVGKSVPCPHCGSIRSHYRPSPEQIIIECEQIRSTWSKHETHMRDSSHSHEPWEVPRFRKHPRGHKINREVEPD
jgi:hypothetical protein